MDTFDFDYCKMTSTGNAFKWDDTINYQTLTENKLELQDNNYFHFYHIQGAHYPRTVTEDVKESTTLVDYPTMVRASINMIDKYLARIKESGAYDNSAIIIMADHGYDDGSEDGRQNPILFVKGFNEKHKMLVSDAPVSYEDLQDLYKNLLDGKKSTELFQNMDPNRVRNYILYVYNAENHMEECTQQGNAQDKTTIKKTGKVFDR
jgi:arylsulfatase A-like enzyme